MNKDKKNKKTANIEDIVLTIGDYSTQELINIARKKYKRDTRIHLCMTIAIYLCIPITCFAIVFTDNMILKCLNIAALIYNFYILKDVIGLKDSLANLMSQTIVINEYIMSTEDYDKYFSFEDFLYKNRNRINEIKKEITK